MCIHHTRRCRLGRRKLNNREATGQAVSSPARRSADSLRSSGGSPRSVHDCGSVICPLMPPAQTNTVLAPRRRAYKNLQPLAVQRVERMSDNNKTRRVTG